MKFTTYILSRQINATECAGVTDRLRQAGLLGLDLAAMIDTSRQRLTIPLGRDRRLDEVVTFALRSYAPGARIIA